MFVLLRLFKTTSNVFCVKFLPELRERETSALQFELTEAISRQHHTVINWKEKRTEWPNCGPGIDAECEHNVNNTLTDKLHLASLVGPVVRMHDAYMIMLRHNGILERERWQS